MEFYYLIIFLCFYQIHTTTSINNATDKNNANVNQNEAKFDIFVVRHGERVDLLYVDENKNWIKDWVKKSFSEGKYVRVDLNMPVSLPDRAGFPNSFIDDTPLTNVGVLQATQTGVGFAGDGITLGYAYSSPALRSIQTCHNILAGMGISDKLKIRIEGGLFEWTKIYSSDPGVFLELIDPFHQQWPTFMSDDELIAAGYNIDKTYTPLISREDLKNQHQNENVSDYYNRSYDVVKKVIAIVKEQGVGNILIAGHAWTLETCSRQLIGKEPRGEMFLLKVAKKIPFCSLVRLKKENSKWTLNESPVPGVKSLENKEFNYEVFLD